MGAHPPDARVHADQRMRVIKNRRRRIDGQHLLETIPVRQRAFAHRLVDAAGVDIVHGHSPHHVQGIEVHRGKLIVYGCGDLLNDYERIAGRAEFLHDQSAVFLPVVARDSGRLVAPWGFADTGGTWALCAARGNPDARIPQLADWLRRDLLSAD